MPKDEPWAPPIVRLSDTAVANLLCWELMEVDGPWWAWVSWVHTSGGRPIRKVIRVRAAGLEPLGDPARYEKVPRRMRGRRASATSRSSKSRSSR